MMKRTWKRTLKHFAFCKILMGLCGTLLMTDWMKRIRPVGYLGRTSGKLEMRCETKRLLHELYISH